MQQQPSIQPRRPTSSTFIAMLSAVAALALALYGQTVHASAILSKPTDVAASFPVFSIDEAIAHLNVTLARPGAHADSAQAEFPATLLLCPTTNCISCFGFDLSTQPISQCLTTTINFQSVAINQPSNEGLPFGVFVGPPGCVSFTQLPAVNTCYNVNPAPFTNYAIN